MGDPFQTQTVAFHLTHNCNLRCSYCYAGEKSATGMSATTAAQAVQFSLSETLREDIGKLNVVFFGGEPLLELDLLCRICDSFYERDNGPEVSFSMSTNGLLLSTQTIDKLSERRVYVSISIDGHPDIQDRQRPLHNGQGSSSILEEVIPRLLTWNPCVDSRCVITPDSARHMDSAVQWIAERGFAYITTALDYSADWTKNDLKALEGSLKRLASWYVNRMLDDKQLYLSCFDERINTRAKEPLKCSERCAIGLRQYSIAPSGTLYPCVQFVGEDNNDEFVIGDIWSGFNETKRLSIYNRAEKEKFECEGCKIRDRCSCWCACANWSSTGRVDKASPIVCEYEKIIMPIADSIGNKLWKKRSPHFIHKHYNPAFPVLNFAENLFMKEVSHADKE